MRNNLSNILFFLKGFTLPTSNTTTNGSFSNLITQPSAKAKTIVQAPLMFVRGGSVYPGYYLGYAGVDGSYWSSEQQLPVLRILCPLCRPRRLGIIQYIILHLVVFRFCVFIFLVFCCIGSTSG